MTSLTHELKILDSIEELSFCTECFQDFPSEKLTQGKKDWQHLCPKCHRFGGDRSGEPIY